MKRIYGARAGPLLVAALVAVGSAGAAAAQSVQFVGTTGGCFGAACTPTNGVGDVVGGLTYTTGGFDVTTLSGLAAIGGTLDDNLGSFTLVASDFTYTTTAFKMLITFTIPTGGPAALFTAAVTGEVNAAGDGGVYVLFDDTPVSWTGPGGYQYSVNVMQDLDLSPGRTVMVTGRVTGAVPEPISLVLLGTGLLGLGAVRRRRNKVS